MMPEKCRLRFTKEIAIATASRLQMAAGTCSVWVFCGMRNSGVSNCSLPLPVLVSDDLLQRLPHVGQSCLLCYVVPRVVLHHFVLMSDSRPEDLSFGRDSEVHNQCEGLWNFTAPVGGKQRITACRFWCSLTSLPVETRVAQNLDEPDCKLKNLVYSDLSVFTHVFALDRDESDCKLQNLVRGNLTSWLLHVFAQDLDASDCRLQNLLRSGLTLADSRVCPGFR